MSNGVIYNVNYAGLRVHRRPGELLRGGPGYKPYILIFVAIVYLAVAFMPAPKSMVSMVQETRPAGYSLKEGTTTITESVNKANKPDEWKAYQAALKAEAAATTPEEKEEAAEARSEAEQDLYSPDRVAKIGLIALVLLLCTALMWGTEALPLGATNILVAVLMYVFMILEPEQIAKAYMKDAVFFIGGILAIAVGVAKTGLDKRIGLILLSRVDSPVKFAFIFLPLISITAGFLSEHALVALLCPVLMGVYKASCIANGVKRDKALALFLFLGLTFAANVGGPASPAAGGRNAIMVGYFADAGIPISFAEWVKYGMPLCIALSLSIATFMFIVLRRRFLSKNINPSLVVKQEVAKLPKMGFKEKAMAVILVAVVICWIVLGEDFAIGGPTIMAVLAMFLCRIVGWQDIQRGVAIDVVGLYASACAIGTALSLTGGALWMARQFTDALPSFLADGNGLIVGVTIMTGTITNFMSDGATVGAIGPVVLPMATLAGVSVWQLGLACSFSSSFANCLIVGTPNNAIAYSMSRDPQTNERLLTVGDFFKYGLPITILSLIVTWFVAIYGYWGLFDWP